MRRAIAAAVVLALIGALFLVPFLLRDEETVAPPTKTDAANPGTVERHRPRAAEAPRPAPPPAQPARIEGVVVELPSNRPLADAEVLVARRRTPPPREGLLDLERPAEPEFRSKSAADGAFTIDVPDGGPWLVTGRADVHADAVRVADGRGPVRLELALAAESLVTINRDKDGAPIAGAEVWVFDGMHHEGVPQAVHVTDEKGVVRLRGRPEAQSILVRAKGYAAYVATSGPASGTIRLTAGYTICGVVRDRAGHGVGGAVLKTFGPDPRTWLSGPDGRFVLDDTGSWQGVCPFEVRADGFAPWAGELVSGDSDAVVVLARVGTVSGIVLMPDGSPAKGADVMGRAKTGAAGTFRFDVAGGTVAVRAHWRPPDVVAFGELSGTAQVDVPEGGIAEGIEIRLAPSVKSYVILRIVDGERRPVIDMRVSIDGVGILARDVRGELVVLGVDRDPGTDVQVRLADAQPQGLRRSERRAVATTQATAGGPATEIVLVPRREFTVEVRGPDGNDVEGPVRPTIELGEDQAYRRVARVREDRTSATWSVDPALRYVLTIDAEGFARVRRDVTPGELASGRIAVRLDAGSAVRGRIVSSDPRAVAEAWLSLRFTAPDGASWSLRHPVRGDGGAFRFEHVAPGGWQLTVHWPQSVVALREAHVTQGADLDIGDVIVSPGATLRGVVRMPDGRPCGGAILQFLLGDDDARRNPLVVTQSDGSFEIDVPAVRSGSLVVARRGFGCSVVDLARVDPARQLDVRLVAEGRVDLRVRLPVPAPLSWSWRVETPDGSVPLRTGAKRMDDRLGFDDRYELSGLPAGPVVVSVTSTQWAFTTEVTVVEGTTVVAVVGPPK